MLISTIKIVLRTIRRHAGYSFINIFGLALGMACCLMIALWVADELSFDRFHEAAADLYRVEEDQSYSGRVYHVTVTPYPLAPALKAEIPEVAEAARVVWFSGQLFRHGDKAFFEDSVRAVDPSFLTMFSFLPNIRRKIFKWHMELASSHTKRRWKAHRSRSNFLQMTAWAIKGRPHSQARFLYVGEER